MGNAVAHRRRRGATWAGWTGDSVAVRRGRGRPGGTSSCVVRGSPRAFYLAHEIPDDWLARHRRFVPRSRIASARSSGILARVQAGAPASSPQATGRIKAFDWLRGAAVLVMIQCHALTLLRPELRAGTLYRRIDFVDGLVAPAFIFAAGFSLALVQIRGAAGGAQTARMLKTMRRLAEVLVVATLVNWMWFPILREPRWIARIDILHCIGLSLLIALPILAGLAKHPRSLRWVSLALAALAFGAAPFAETVRGPLAALLNTSTESIFPLVPWAGYVYLGASAGAAASAGGKRLQHWLLGLAALGALISLVHPLLVGLYPPKHLAINEPTTHGERLAIVCLLTVGLVLLEQRSSKARRASRIAWFVEVFGTSSLAAYFFHQALLYYGDWGFSFYGRWGNRSGWAKYCALTAALIGATFVLARIVDWLYRRASSLRLGPTDSGRKAALSQPR